MRKFGLIGGTSWHSTVEYYVEINRAINARHGDNTNPRLNLASLDQKRIHDLQKAGDWDAIRDLFVGAAIELQITGIEGLALCASTPHKIFEALQTRLRIPVLHIADAIATELTQGGWRKAGLLGTRFTMEETFIRGRLAEAHGVETIVPPEPVRREIQARLYERLSLGVFDDETRRIFVGAIDSLHEAGAEAVILGCTEFPLLLQDTPCALPVVDSLKCHAGAIVRFIAGDECPA